MFLPAWEDHFFPGKNSKERLEEERRLAFVAITRAKERVFISSVLVNRDGLKHKSSNVSQSRFIKELDTDFVKKRRSKSASIWIHNKRWYVKPSTGIDVDDIVSHNPYHNKKDGRINYGYGKVVGILGKDIEVEFNGSGTVTVKKTDVTKVILPAKKCKDKKGLHFLYNEK